LIKAAFRFSKFLAVLLVCAVLLPSGSKPSFADFKAGMEAVKKLNYKTAYLEFKVQADKGHAPSQYSLGLLHHHGRGRPVDLKAAREWYKKAAIIGHTGAQNNLGTLYRDGLGTKRDYTAAAYWFKKASGEHALAMNNLAILHRYGLGVKKK